MKAHTQGPNVLFPPVKPAEGAQAAPRAAHRKYFENLQDFLNEYKVDAEIIDLKVPMKTSEAAAEQLKTHVSNIFKSVFLVHKKGNSKEYALVVLPGDGSVDLQKLAAILEWNPKKISFADAATATAKTGFIAGGTAPLGHKDEFPVVIDERIRTFDFGYGGGGRPELLLKIKPDELIKHTNAKVADVSKGVAASRAAEPERRTAPTAVMGRPY